MNRRSFLGEWRRRLAIYFGAALRRSAGRAADLGFRFTDVTVPAGIQFQHNSGAFGGKFLPETLGSGCAFLDYDAMAGKTSCSSMAPTGPDTSEIARFFASIATTAMEPSLM